MPLYRPRLPKRKHQTIRRGKWRSRNSCPLIASSAGGRSVQSDMCLWAGTRPGPLRVPSAPTLSSSGSQQRQPRAQNRRVLWSRFMIFPEELCVPDACLKRWGPRTCRCPQWRGCSLPPSRPCRCWSRSSSSPARPAGEGLRQLVSTPPHLPALGPRH